MPTSTLPEVLSGTYQNADTPTPVGLNAGEWSQVHLICKHTRGLESRYILLPGIFLCLLSCLSGNESVSFKYSALVSELEGKKKEKKEKAAPALLIAIT